MDEIKEELEKKNKEGIIKKAKKKSKNNTNPCLKKTKTLYG